MPKVTVVMPSLNVAPYIRECMDSVISQTLKEIEIVCVDAGSTDGTLEILQEYSIKDSRVRLINSDKKSYGYQMNLGFDLAKGEYLGIVETDDYIESSMFQVLYETAIEKNYDYVKSNFFVFTDDPQYGRLTLQHKIFNSSGYHFVSCTDYVNHTVPIDTFMWNGIYRRDFVENNHIRLNETSGAAYQDAGFRYQVAFTAKNGVYIPSAFYHYRRDNETSSMHSPKALQYDLQESQFIMDWANARFPCNTRLLRSVSWEIAMCCIRSIKGYYLAQNDYGNKLVQLFRKLLIENNERGLLNDQDFSIDKWIEIEMLLENERLFQETMRYTARAELALHYSFLSLMQDYKQIVIFGCGKVGECTCYYLMCNGNHNTVCFCDNDRSKWGGSRMGKQIIAPANAATAYPDAIFIIANRTKSVEMINQLTSLNIDREKIYVYRFSSDPIACSNKLSPGKAG
ncbi:glycosyltransferase family 2 protein [Desulfobacter curvatus]|uniref:glycosyltransferase family 2 protein n=1 Tax=Desulfobacter curvatus TaxID=2290 RepID=UPI000381CEED|nr:glycosyltransferase family 2 protein [Desulfobacter curvatus]